MKATILLAGLLLACQAQAARRCTLPDGRIVFTDRHTCEAGAPGQYVDDTPNVLDSSGERDQWQIREEEEAEAAARAAAAARSAPSASGAPGGASRACEEARRHLEIEQGARLNRNEQAIQTARVQVDITCSAAPAEGPAPSTGNYACQTALRNYEVESTGTDALGIERARRAAETACGRTSKLPTRQSPKSATVRSTPPHQENDSHRAHGPCISVAGGLTCPDGFYNRAAGGYFSPHGGFCTSVAGGVSCPDHFIPR
jgi:hypothetical protein